jgi:hypothetical protein
MEAGDEVLLISGEPPPEDQAVPLAVVEGLGYDRYRGPVSPPGKPSPASSEDIQKAASALAGDVILAMKNHWGTEADILHVHNPLIQKNTVLVPALKILHRRGIRLLLQNHDLAEDFRPDVYLSNEDYPENCHYGVINSRDYSFLHRAGLKTEGLHLLPNEVFPLRASPGLAKTRYLYPVRAIRRKNIGEALLLSLFIPKGTTVAVTLPPTTEKDEGVYQRWVNCARELSLPVEFAVGAGRAFSDIIGSSIEIITTSVKEGFGFSFLEPWTAHRAVIGRRIDYVCKDFEDAGVRFDSLYPGIEVPADYVSPLLFYKKMEHTMTGVFRAFGMEPPEYIIKLLNEEIFSRDTVDFGRLDEELQESIIRTLCSNRAVLRDILTLNPFLEGLAERRSDESLIESNRTRILEAYGKERTTALLRDTYRSVISNPVVHRLSKSTLLELYLNPLRLSLVGVGK